MLKDRAALLALLIPAVLLGGAYISEYGFGLYPCEMCWWQRYAHFAALALAVLALVLRGNRLVVGLAAVAIGVSGLIGLFHAGVEYGWWQGFTACTANPVAGGGNPLDAIMNAPMVRCDTAQWDLFGISLAGWNFLFSVGGALVVFLLLRRPSGARA